MQHGTVKWFNNAKGFGFILQEEANEDVFVHYSVIEGDGFRTLKQGDRVEFDATRGPKGLHATAVRRPVEVPMAASPSSPPMEDMARYG